MFEPLTKILTALIFALTVLVQPAGAALPFSHHHCPHLSTHTADSSPTAALDKNCQCPAHSGAILAGITQSPALASQSVRLTPRPDLFPASFQSDGVTRPPRA